MLIAVSILLILIAAVALAVPRIKAFAERARAKRIEEDAQLQAWRDANDERREAIAELPLSVAREQALALLADPRYFECTESSDADASRLDFLAPELLSLFQRYETIESVSQPCLLDRNEIQQVKVAAKSRRKPPPFWIIGWEDGGHWVVVVKAGEEGIFVTDDFENTEEMIEPDYPSVYHWLLTVSSGAE